MSGTIHKSSSHATSSFGSYHGYYLSSTITTMTKSNPFNLTKELKKRKRAEVIKIMTFEYLKQKHTYPKKKKI